MDEGLPHTFKHTQYDGDSTEATTFRASESKVYLISNQFQVASEDEIQEIEVRREWRPKNISAASNPFTGASGINVVTHSNSKICYASSCINSISGAQSPVFFESISEERAVGRHNLHHYGIRTKGRVPTDDRREYLSIC